MSSCKKNVLHPRFGDMLFFIGWMSFSALDMIRKNKERRIYLQHVNICIIKPREEQLEYIEKLKSAESPFKFYEETKAAEIKSTPKYLALQRLETHLKDGYCLTPQYQEKKLRNNFWIVLL